MDTYLVSAHECNGQPCAEPARLRRSVKLGCGCTRHECDRHDGTVGVHFLTGGCDRHEADDVTDAVPHVGEYAAYLQGLAEQFPGRDRRGYVVGFYVYAGYGVSETRESGPFPTQEEAQGRTDGVLDGHVVCGHVFTASGKIIQAPRGGAPDAEVAAQ